MIVTYFSGESRLQHSRDWGKGLLTCQYTFYLSIYIGSHTFSHSDDDVSSSNSDDDDNNDDDSSFKTAKQNWKDKILDLIQAADAKYVKHTFCICPKFSSNL